MRFARPVRGLVFLGFLGTTVLGGIEIAVRLLHLAPPLNRQYPGMVTDPWLPYRPEPNSAWKSGSGSGEFAFETKHSSLGFRDVEHGATKEPGTFRILGLGDSFTYGVGADYSETYLARTEALLNARPGPHPRVEIVKAGIPRYFPEPERILLEHYGLPMKPDLVTVCFIPNDVIDTFMGLSAVTPTPDGFLQTREASELGPIAHWLFFHSHASRIVLSKVVARRVARKYPVYWDDLYLANGRHEAAWRKVEAEYERMAALAGGIGAKLVILHIPERGPWSPESPARYPPRRLAEWAAKHGVMFVDTLPALDEASRRSPEKLYWDQDPHCTGAGYRVVAETLAAELSRQGLVP